MFRREKVIAALAARADHGEFWDPFAGNKGKWYNVYDHKTSKTLGISVNGGVRQ